MLLALLLHVLIYHLLSARDAPPRKDTQYIVQHIDTCPAVGYYFWRVPSANALEAGSCFLCFCQEDNTAVCWKRDNRRCNAQSYKHHAVGKRSDTRIRRSPGFADIFFRDAARDAFNRNGKQDCKPYESSFSDDCPPVDWCIGCTVCDCDANGHWDCHVLSFCPDGKSKNKGKAMMKGGSMRTVVGKKPVKKSKSTTSNIPKRTPPGAAKKNKPVNKGRTKSAPIQRRNSNDISQHPRKRIFKKSVPVNPDVSPGPQKRRSPIRYKRISPTKSDAKKEMIIKKNIGTHKPINIGSTKVNLEMEIAQKVMKKVITNLRHSIDGEMKNISNIATRIARNQNSVKRNVKNYKKPNGKSKARPKPAKKVNKRQAKKPQRKPPSKWKKPIKKPTKRPMKKPIMKSTKQPTRKPTSKKYVRDKRNVKMAENFDFPTIFAQDNHAKSINQTTPYSIVAITNNLLVPDDDNCSLTSERSSTLGEDKYYKYIVGMEEPSITDEELMGFKRTTQVNRTETVFNLIGTPVTPIISSERSQINKDEKIKINNSTEINPEANNLKYSKWSHLKILKEKKIKSSSDKHLSLVKFITHANQSILLDDYKNKVHGKDVERKLNSRKYNLVKLLKHPKYKTKRDHSEIDKSTDLQSEAKKIGDLQSLVSNILRGVHKNSTTYPPKKNKKFNVLRYLKRFFNKIFRRKKSTNQFSKHHLVDTLCESFGPCKITRRDKELLNTKLAELDEETQKILKTVKIIKGLLKLVELPKSPEADSFNQDSFRNDMNKLNNILKDTYAKYSEVALSPTQLTQIDYIKRNTQDFIQSVTKFASLLNEIVIILTKHNKNISKNYNRILRNNLVNKNITKEDPFLSLKQLLVKYNLIQNSFMKRMYEQLNNFENKMIEKPKVSEVQDFNNSVAIENFSRNIIRNLRKLKRLAQTVSYSGRSKREAMRDDDAIEYLLMLMEYMLKQNHPLDVAPVNDGIDLLIEAIKNAPDIKPIKKKVLDYTSSTNLDYVTTTVPTSITTDPASSDDDSPSDSDKSSSEDSGRLKLEDTDDTLKNKMEENKDLNEMIGEDDKEPEDKYQYDRKAGIDKVDDITEMAFYNRAEDNIIQEPETGFETTTTVMPLQMENSDKLDEQGDNNVEKEIAIEHNNIDKVAVTVGTVGDAGADEKRFEVFTADMDEELILPGTVTTPATDIPTTMTTELTTQAKKSRSKMRHLNLESYDIESIDKKSKLEWIEENFRRENEKDITDFEEFNTTLSQTVTVTPRTSVPKTIDKVDISSLTRENVDEADKKNKAKINAEEVMLRKQMDLLNSLDYGTEKTELYESDSKDGNVDDKYSSDTFPTYFV